MRNHNLKPKESPRLARRIVTIVWAGVAMSPMITSALAQYTAQLSERESKPILEYFLTIGFVVLCVGIAAMNPKRSHQA